MKSETVTPCKSRFVWLYSVTKINQKFCVVVAAGNDREKMMVDARTLRSPGRFADALLKQHGLLVEECLETRNGSWSQKLWHEQIDDAMSRVLEE